MSELTAAQITAIDTQLSVDLSTVADDRLIELCLLYRSAPSVKPSFLVALNTEITRRFTAVEIAANEVMFSVIQNFANQFTSGVPLFAKKMLEMSASVNRDIWFSNNNAMFAEAIEDETLLEWLVTQPDVVTKILNNTLGLTAIAKSYKASSAILSNAETVAIFKGATNVWQIATGQSEFMDVLLLSNELMTYVSNNAVAMAAVAASSTAMAVVAASSTAITAVIESSTAMAAVATSSVALSAIVNSVSLRNALMANNTVLQGVRQQIYNTVKASWVKKVGVISVANMNITPMTEINNAVVSPLGFVFASLGHYGGTYSNGISNITHPNGVLAASKGTSAQPTSLANLDAISFNSSTFNASVNVAQAYAELWSPT